MQKITSRRNPVCAHLKKLGESRRYRYESGEMLCDGLKLLEDAVNSGARIASVVTSEHLPFPLPIDTRVYSADRGLINSLSPLKNAQGTVFSCGMPEAGGIDGLRAPALLLDGMQDPGNVGAIIRTADAFGIPNLLLFGECADPYNPKAVRASMGAVFRQRLVFAEPGDLRTLICSGFRLVGAVARGADKSVAESCLGDAIVAIGNEGRGLSEAIAGLCDETVGIPVSPECESLNAAVAAAIIMWETVKQRITKQE